MTLRTRRWTPRIQYEELLLFRDRAVQYKGLGAVWRPGFFADRRFCTNVAWLVNDEMGDVTIWEHESGDGVTTFFAVL